jgi:hypothetical protein
VLPERRRRLLWGIVALLLAVGGWSYFASQGGGSTPAPAAGSARGTARRQTPPPKSGESLPEAEAVRLTSLAQSREEPSSAIRNPFKFKREAPAVSAKTPESAPIFKPMPGPDSPGATDAVSAAPAIPLKFIGLLEKTDGAKWAVLSMGDGRPPLHGKEGDIIDGRYRILKIGNESIDLAYVDGRGRQTIRLTGQ